MATYIQLTIVRSPLNELYPEYGASRVYMAVTDSVDIDPAIFVFQRHVAGESTGYSGEFFYSVAGLVEMADLPDIPSGSIDEPFYRSSSITLDFASNEEAEEAILKIQKEVGFLVKANDFLLDPATQVTEVVDFGTVPAIPSGPDTA
jgi:hypothetical protein